MSNQWENSDDLTEDDLQFLAQWENAGHDSKEHEALEIEQVEGHGEVEAEVVGESDNKTEGEGDSDEPDSGESDEVDDSKMDISQVEDNSDEWSDSEDDDSKSEPDHLESGDDAPDEISEGESELEYDDLEEESGEDQIEADDDTYEDDEVGQQDRADDEWSEIEEEFGDGERGDTDSEIDDLDEYEQEREENQEQEINADAEEDFDGDAQEELEDHLEAEKEQEKPKGEEKSDPEPLVEQPDENQEEGEEQHSGKFKNLPEAGDLCTNHCEDNEAEESLDESCPHCTERIRAERELHGAIATDMHGKDILPGDRLLVRIPIGMIAKDSIITANVPNMEVDPERLAVTTVGKRDKERCWLAGKGVSNFTGWRMTGAGNAIWTFQKGQTITFAEKVAQPLFDELDPDKMMEDLADELDNYGKDNQDNGEEEEAETDIQESEDEQHSDSDQGEEDQDEEDEPEDLEEHRERRERDELTSVQRKRFENLTNREWKKILNTFGSTIEAERLKDVEELNGGKVMRRVGNIVSRGVTYSFGFAARKAEGNEIEEIEQWHKDREEDDAA